MKEAPIQLTLFGDLPLEKPKPKLYTRDYGEFVEKFRPRLTTDDCYTPPRVYDAVLGWVRENCGIKPTDTILRPFRPGGDYEAEDYTPDTVVVDNPPFSILSRIIRFYLAWDVRFFLFAPYLTLFSTTECTKIVTASEIVYENGASVASSFATNMMGDVAIMTAPDLAAAVAAAVAAERKAAAKAPMPKYDLPDEVVTSARMGRIARHVGIRITRDECLRVSRIDAMAARGKALFGAGYLISGEKAAELKAAELKERYRFALSGRERETVRGLGRAESAVSR